MGFLKFLKREKKEEHQEDLDLPPAPPKMDGFDDMNFDFPDMDSGKMPPDDRMPEFDFPKANSGQFNKNVPDLPDFSDFEKDYMPSPLAPANDLPPTPPELPEHDEEKMDYAFAVKPSQPKTEIEAPGQSRKEADIFEGKNLYLRVEKYRAVLDNISSIKSGLRKSEEDLLKIEGIKSSKDRVFERFKSSLDDLQRKIIFVDKTLFKGDLK